MKERLFYIAIIAAVVCSCGQKDNGRWSVEKANEWMNEQGWIVGCDYVPAYASNHVEFWQGETFNPEEIDKELGYAESLGFNTIRVFLQGAVCFYDREGFKQRFNQFLDICQSHGIRVIVTPPSYGISGHLGKQPDPPFGIHNPGANIPVPDDLSPEIQQAAIEKIVKDLIKTHRKDDRILMWSLCNESEAVGRQPGKSAVPILTAQFKWARSCRPTQPLTSPIMTVIGSKSTSMPEVSFMLENCDIISFHCYDTGENLEKIISQLEPYGRPMVCTEYMARPKSTFGVSMPILKEHNIGAISWGLVAGRDNTIFPWNKKDENGYPIPWETEPEVWFHNILYPDGTPYNEDEVALIREMTGAHK